MTDIAINPVTRRVQFTGNTGTGPYAFTFNILQSSDITVYKNNALFTLTTDYTVSIASNGTGSVTTVVALISSDILTIIGGRQLSRTTDFVTAGDLLASSLNEQLDSNVIMSQQLDERFDRSMKAQPGDTNANMNLPLVADRANGFLTFDNSGNVAINTIQNLDLLNLVQLNIGNITIEGDTVSTSSGNGLAFSSGDDLELAVPASNARIYFKRATATAIDWSLGSSHQSLRFINTSSGGVSASIDATHLTSSASALEIRSEGAALTLNSGDGTIPLEHDGTQRGYLNLDTAGTIKIYTGTGTGTLNTTFSSDALTVVGTLTAGALFIGGANISEVELEMLDSITAGTVAASKAVVVDANKDISSFRNVTISGKITSDSNADVTIEPNGSGDFVVETDSSHFRNTDAGQFGPKLFLDHATSSPATSDYNAQVYFKTTDLGSNIIYPLRIDVLSPDVTDSAATGKALFNIKEDGASDPIAYLELDGDSEEIILWKNTSISGDVTATGSFIIGSASMSESDLEQLDGITAGTVAASKALVVDSNKKLNELLVDHLSLNSRTLSSTESNGHLYITPNGTGNVYVASDLVMIGANDEATRIILAADNSDDNGDDWVIQANTSQTLQIGNDISGSQVAHLTITPHATVASSTSAFAGKITSGGAIEPASLSIHNTTSAASVYLQQDASGPQPLSKFFMIMNGGPQTYASDTAYIHVDDGTINIRPADGVSGASISVAGVVDITNSTDATDATGDTGALRTEGGASIAKKLFVGTDLDVTGAAQIDGILTTTAATVFNGGFASNADSSIATAAGGALSLTSTDVSVNADQLLGKIEINSSDGSSSGSGVAASIQAVSDAAFTGQGRPSSLIFSTFTSGSALAEKLKIDNAGNIIIASTGGTLQTATAGGTSNLRLGINAGAGILDGALNNTVVGTSAGTAINTGDQNTFVGAFSGEATATTADNTALGLNALRNNVGSYNTALGSQALRTSGDTTYNTAVGYKAGYLVSTGIYNTLIGGLVGDALTDADYNVAMGVSALGVDTLGSRSVAIGYSALAAQNFTTATDTYNTAVGHKAGAAVTSGIENTLIGGLAGDALTGSGFDGSGNRVAGADQNVVVGYGALTTDTKGGRNVAIGGNALSVQNFTTAEYTYNTAIGANAGSAIAAAGGEIPGRFNTLIGGLAGDNITTGDSNIIIGHNIDAASATADDQLNIGGWIQGVAGKIGIGTAAPDSYLANELVVAAADEGGITLAGSSTSHKQNIFFSDGTSGSARNRGNLSYDHINDSLTMGTASGSARFLMDNTGAVTLANGLTLTDGNLVVAAGHGIDFSAQTATATGSTTSELLDHYEEGTFTPVYVATGTAFGAITHNVQSGYYTRIGNVVNFSLALRTGAFTLGSGSGIVQINGLPFSAAGTDTFPVAINAQSAWTNYMPFGGWVSSTVITLTNNAGGSDRTGYRTIPVANMDTGTASNRIYLTGTYITS